MELVDRSIRLTVLFGLSVTTVALAMGKGSFAVGLLGGTLWSVANLWVLKALLGRVCGSRRPRWQMAWLLGLKFPLLYGIGAWMCVSQLSSPVGFVIGLLLWQACVVFGACTTPQSAC